MKLFVVLFLTAILLLSLSSAFPINIQFELRFLNATTTQLQNKTTLNSTSNSSIINSNATGNITSNSSIYGTGEDNKQKSLVFWIAIGCSPVALILILLVSILIVQKCMEIPFRESCVLVVCCNCESYSQCRCFCCRGEGEEGQQTVESDVVQQEGEQQQDGGEKQQDDDSIQKNFDTITMNTMQSQIKKQGGHGKSKNKYQIKKGKEDDSLNNVEQNIDQELEDNYLEQLRQRSKNAQTEQLKLDFQIAAAQRKLQQQSFAQQDLDFIENEVPSADLNRSKVIEQYQSKNLYKYGNPSMAFANSLSQGLQRIQEEAEHEDPYAVYQHKRMKFIQDNEQKFDQNQKAIFYGGVSSSFDLIKDHVGENIWQELKEYEKQKEAEALPMYMAKKDRRIIPPIPALNYLQVGNQPFQIAPPSLQFYDDLYEYMPSGDQNNQQINNDPEMHWAQKSDLNNRQHYQFSHQFNNNIHQYNMNTQKKRYNDGGGGRGKYTNNNQSIQQYNQY